jgi:hypothetical protein
VRMSDDRLLRPLIDFKGQKKKSANLESLFPTVLR